MKIGRVSLWVAVFTAISGSVIIGCQYFPESTFQLANDSRLPKWIVLPPGHTRADVSITMSYYSKPWGRTATFIVQDTRKQLLTKVVGTVKCNEPFRLKKPTQDSASEYPAYELITTDGTSEIIEHRKMEPIFYLFDDPEVRGRISSGGCD